MANESKKEKFIRLEMTTDMNYTELAKELNVSERTLYNWRKDPEFQSMKDKLVTEAFTDYATKAFKSVYELSQNAKSEFVKMQAAADILDRAGFKPTEKTEVEHSGVVQFVDDIE